MRLPEAREELRAVIQELAAEGREELLARLFPVLNAMYRRRRAPERKPIAKPMTPELRAQIRAFANDYPELTQLQIGNHFGVNPGRVSEAVYGKRH